MKQNSEESFNFDVIVVGGGHAGVEAASAAARIGAKTALITKNIDDLGVMSCNPAIGGLGKGQIVREIDALGGLMGFVADQSGIQFKTLNRSRGPAVRGPRAQIDRALYKRRMSQALKDISSLHIIEAMTLGINLLGNKIQGVKTSSGTFFGRNVVITTGTFLRGEIHIGNKRLSAGRLNELPSIDLGKDLENNGLTLGRLKTGTPPRIDRETINFTNLEEQRGDDEPEPFSYLTTQISNPQICCHITRTCALTHEIILKALPNSPLFNGSISGRGPRYCPSIEDKVTRFSDREAHQIFLEPEGLDSKIIYPNGISTSLPEEIQEKFVRSIPGLEQAKILQPGYAIEYDFFQPQGLLPTLETKSIKGLFLAGQINGTTGYEEAAGQGLVAGANAALKAANKQSFILSRIDSYIGVMIDDLITRPLTEPYRMFTSRSEYRLRLRADNADMRLTELGASFGLISGERLKVFRHKKAEVEKIIAYLKATALSPTKWRELGFSVNLDGVERSAYEILSRHDVSYSDLENIGDYPYLNSRSVRDFVESEAKYSVYLKRQEEGVSSYKTALHLTLEKLDFLKIPGLSTELSLRLHQMKPQTLAHASAMEGMTPAALALLTAYARK